MMRSLTVLLALFVAVAANAQNTRFASVDIYLESDQPIAAWQFNFSEARGRVQIVGVESGDSAAFTRAPYYDRQAVNLGTADQITVANYTLAALEKLSAGRIRIATLHVMISGDGPADYELSLITASSYEGRSVEARIYLETTDRSAR